MVNLKQLEIASQNAASNFVHSEQMIQRMKLFITMNEAAPRTGNAIFWGPGGYGKSELVEQFLTDATGQMPFVCNMNQATTAMEMFGGVNLQALIEDSELRYNFENSWMNHEWVIMEEALETRARVLASQKYPITSGMFSAAGTGTSIPIKTKGIIILTNVDTATLQDDMATRAFLERFAIKYYVSWNHLNAHQRFQASMGVVDKFDNKHYIPNSMRQSIAKFYSDSKQSPREIAQAVLAMVAMTKAHQLQSTTDEIFQQVASVLGFATRNVTQEIEDARIDQEIKDAKEAYEEMFANIAASVTKYQNLRGYLNDPYYITRLATELKSTMELLASIKDSVKDMRIYNRFGNRGDELASWVNSETHHLIDKMDDIKNAAFNGLLAALIVMLEKE